ncbi:hypothetical protein R3W88_026885 [Solanum pinnatisectum]|uniref:PB1-like domain-containing protein n=1 Tax=Solanum pinnatisectum TaxID=50273 RepID=A0AAV9LEG1_9SOLN|nr:hypothetical protein R3W88_026885 [Solanum pinnatisectum]
MASTIITLQMHYGGCFSSDPELRYANGISDLEKIRIDMDELHIMFFHKLARDLGVEKVETFGCKVNKRGGFYMLKSDVDVLRFINNLKGGDFVDVYVVHQISTPLIVEDPTEVADVSSPQPSNKNDTNIKEDQQSRVGKGKNNEVAAPEVSSEDLDEDKGQGQGNDFSSYHLQTSDESNVDIDAKQSDSESFYDVDENIDDLSDLDSKFVEARQINVDEIPSGPAGIDAGFEDIYKNKRGRYKGKLGGDDLYFDSSDPDSDISEDEGDHVDSDEVVDPLARNSSTKKNGYTTGTARTAIGGSGGATTSTASTSVIGGATGGSGGATTSAASTCVTAGGSGGAITKRPTTTSATFRGATTAATTTGGSAANISLNFTSVAQPTSQFSTQQSTTSASGSKKSSKVKRDGANLGYKRPRTAGFGVLFGANGSVIERSGTTDRVLHCAPLKSSVPTNIDLGYKPNGLRWKGGAAVT